MVALSDRKIEIVRTLVESAPDKIVGGLQRALAETGGDTVLASVRQIVDAETRDRLLRNAVFQPVAPLCVGDGSDKNSLVFPARTLACIWRGLKAQVPADVAAAGKASADVATAIASDRRPPDPNPAFDSLVRVTADALRSSDQRDFRAAAELCDRARPGGAEALAACLDIAPVVRRAIARLPEWVAHPTGDTNAAARLAYKDSVAIAEDAGPRFFEMLAGQLTPPWMVLRIISAVMDKPTERYLADSELGGFPERVMNAVDEELRAIGGMDLDAGPEAGRAAGRLVELITQQVFELEVCIELTRDTGWGRRIVGQKQSLANLVEARLRDADKLSTAALPLQSSGFSRPRRTGPKLESPPDAKVVGRVMTLLHFAHEIRRCANYGGFSAAHAKAMEKIGGMIDHYVDEVFDQVRTGDVEDLKIAHAYLRAAADFNGLVRDDKAAELLRRRSAAACEADSPQPLKPKAG
ncbi:MAG: hypothetical protein JWP28_422 [Phenylobacterium sp.]|jgi:hypothetical protein|uniref:hypothetical protein n=1 Tax=Phenylobacterium sp. TaxID=1871053 RepID=UPI002619A37E|nr:hypothetical protein [Phenylobacterium sp.]MDB5496391.1 hypothetical protein [Phenylobacterium sp.]